ncbi:di-heme oxidoreductase family protein [Oceanibaculum pacificum]|nr:di-heme oxidoredictase family protein [Oceanibaculum pacificum]
MPRLRRHHHPVLGLAIGAGLLAAAMAPLSAASPAEKARIAAVVKPATSFDEAEKFEVNQAGGATVHKPLNTSVFSHPSGTMSFEKQLDFRVGDGIFRKIWVSAPSSTLSSDGLGPLFNSRSCQGCHLKDGRGSPPAENEAAVSMFLRLSIPAQDAAQQALLDSHRVSIIADPVYGTQLQNFAIQGHEPEGEMKIAYEEIPVTLSDGAVVTLRKPTYSAENLKYGPLHPGAMLSPRVAPPMIGMGLLEAVAEADILSWADPDDKDGDGISGRANRIWDVEKGELALGRFGWKAGEPNMAQQVSHAFAGDIGLSSYLTPTSWGECTEPQKICREAPTGDDEAEGVEVTRQMMDLVVFYSRNLGVPARRDVDDPTVLRGKQMFYETGCTACHRPKFVTQRLKDMPEQSFQLIWPYTDMLLHDMGEGLADGRPESVATGSEWRTPPLWGIGLTEIVSGHTNFLHDGRARNLLEAILWHGGEAEPAKQRVVEMSKDERDALLAFLNSL